MQHIFASATGASLQLEQFYLVAIVILACLVGAEVAGICILISKAMRAKAEQEIEEASDPYRYHGAILLLGAVPEFSRVALPILAISAVVGAVVFLALLVIFRAKGYILLSSRREAPAAKPMPEQAAEELSEQATAEANPLDGYFSEDAVEPDADEGMYSEEVAEREPIQAESAEETADESALPEAVPAPVAAQGIPIYSSANPYGQAPVVEKHIVETYREVIRETNTTTTTEKSGESRYSPATEEILEAIAKLMKLETQLRTERQMPVEPSAAKKDESVPTFAETPEAPMPEPEELDEDEDETDVEDAADENDEDVFDEADGEDSERFSGNERIVGFDEETGCYIVAHYRKSFEAKLIQATHFVKKAYSEVKNALLAYENTKTRISWTGESVTNDRTQVAKLNARGRTLELYLALDPESLADSAYRGRDVSAKKKYAETPFLYRVNSPRKLMLALELVQRTAEELGLSPIDAETVNYEEQYPFDSIENLILRGLVREYLREEKPAVTFELAPDHVTQVPEEDGSVIPVNANFTWELDDEQPEPEPEPAPEPEPEPETEPEPEPEVTSEPEAAPESVTTTTTHETVRVTERRYTETYYGTPAASAPVVPEPIEVLAVPSVAEESVEENALEEVEEVEEVEEAEETEETEEAEETEETEEAEEVEEVEETEEAEETEGAEEAEEAEEIEEIEETEDEALVWSDVTEDEVSEELSEEIEEPEDIEEEVYEEEVEEIEEPEEIEEEIYEEEVEEVEDSEEIEEEVYEEEIEDIEEIEEVEELAEEEEIEEEAEPVKPTIAPATDSRVALLDVCLFDTYFENGATVTLDALKELGLASPAAEVLKVYASGKLRGQYTVEANHFTLDAIKAIGEADGDSVMIR